MSEPMKDAWNEVAEGFAKLGSVMRDRYRGGTEDAAPGLLPTLGQQPTLGRRPASSGCGRRSSGSSRPAETLASARWMWFVTPT